MKETQNKGLIMAEQLLLYLYYVLACSYIPLCSFLNINQTFLTVASVAVCVLGAFALSRAAGTFKALIAYSATIVLFAVFFGGIFVAGILSAFVSAVCIFAHLLLKAPSPFLWGLPAIPAIIVLLAVGTPVSAVIALAPLPAAVGLWMSFKNELGKVAAICRISLGICASLAVALLLAVYSAYGDISFGIIRQAVEAAREWVTELSLSAIHELEDMLGGADTLPVNFEANIEYYVGIVFNVLPAAIIILSNAVAYFIHSTMFSIEFVTLKEKMSAFAMTAFSMSIVSAAVFAVSFGLSLAPMTGKAALIGAVAQNIAIVLIPGFVISAVTYLHAMLSLKFNSCLGTIVYIICIFLIASLNPIVLSAAAVAGCTFTVISHIKSMNNDRRK